MLISNTNTSYHIILFSEFDIAAYVVHVGDAYTDGQQKKQWVFVTDGSIQYPHSHSDKISHSLLAISFTTPSIDDYPIPNNLVGSVVCTTNFKIFYNQWHEHLINVVCVLLLLWQVGFCNLIKRAKDVNNDMWVCEATENSVYFVNAESPYSSHLKTSSGHIQTWAKLSSSLPVRSLLLPFI